MKEKNVANEKRDLTLSGKKHSVKMKFTHKDAKDLMHEFMKGKKDTTKHELAVDCYVEHPDFSEGFKVFSVIHVLEDIAQHILNRSRPEPEENFTLPFEVQELGGVPQYIPYLSETGQLRNILASEAQWFHLNSWRDLDNRATQRRSRRNKSVNRVVGYFEPVMKGTKLKLRHVCETLAKKPS